MRALRLTFLLLFAALSVQAIPIPSIALRHRVLQNGLQVYSVQDRTAPTVAIQVWYHVGSKDDPAGRSGFAHLFEHIMFKSTKNMPAEMMDRLTEDVGGFNNAGTNDDYTLYYEVVPSNYLETLLWAESERMGSLTVDEANFKSERDVVKEEYRYSVLAPTYGRFFNAIARDSFTTHPYRRPTIGNIEELDAATIGDVQAFHTTFYRPDNAYLLVVGDFDPQQLDGWIDRYFAPLSHPDTPVPRVSAVEPPRSEEKRFDEYAPNVPLPALALTWLTPAASAADSVPLVVAATLLSEGESSRLERRLVRGEIAQEIFAEADLREDASLFVAGSILASGHPPAEAEKILREEIDALAKTPVSEAELQKAKNLIVTSALRQRETSNGKASILGEALILQHDPEAVNSGLVRVQAVTPADVQRVVKKYLVDGKAVVIRYADESEKKNAAAKSSGGVK